MPKKEFRRKTSVKPVHKALLAFDVENDPKTGAFICAGAYGYREDHHGKEHLVERYFDDQKEFLRWMNDAKTPKSKNLPYKLITFNLAYDYWFISTICDDSQLLSVNARIIMGKLNNGIPIMDLTNHVDGTLEDWIGYLEMPKKFNIKKETLDNLKVRVMSDARATYELGHFLEDFYVYEMGITLKMTVASCARELYQQKFFRHFWVRDNEEIDTMERMSYRGGRVEVFMRGRHVVNGEDVNSMYLDVMHKQLIPDPNTVRVKRNLNELPEGMFIAKVEVEVPEQHIGPLPYYDKVMKKLLFPVGCFTGVYCSPELNYAIKECGVKITKIDWVLTYKGYPYFRDYAAFVWGKRQEYKAKGNKGMDLMVKKLGNSLYGSFGQRNTLESFYGKLSDFGEIEEGMQIESTEINGIDYVSISSPEKEDSRHTFPCIPSFITSYARLKLLKALRANADSVVYTDTDSIKVEGKAKGIEIGKGLGEWGDEEKDEAKDFYRAKVYGDKVKGVPKRAKIISESESERVYQYEKPNKMKESFRRGLMPNKWEEIMKVISLVDDKRIWVGDVSEPRKIDGVEVLGGDVKC